MMDTQGGMGLVVLEFQVQFLDLLLQEEKAVIMEQVALEKLDLTELQILGMVAWALEIFNIMELKMAGPEERELLL